MSWQEKVATYKLDVSIIPTSELEGLVRLEPEFYSRDFLFRKKALERLDTVYLDDIATIVSGAAYSSEEIFSNKNHEDDIHIIKIGDVTNKRPFNDLDFISLVEVDKFASDLVSENDILMTMTGDPPDVGKVHIWYEKPKDENLTFNQRVCKIRPKKKSGFSPFGLYAYLMTEYARFQCERFAMGIRQRNVSIKDIKRLPVPRFSDAFLQKVDAIVSSAFSLLNSSKIAMRAAEAIVLQEIGVADGQQAEKNISIRSVIEATQANRFDAEYWQPKYDAMLKRIATYKGGVSTVGEQFTALKNNFRSEAEKTYRYIEIGDVSTSNGEVGYTELSAVELPANAKTEFEERQLIASKVRPNRGAVTILDDHKGYIGSGAFTVLKEKGQVPLEVLMVYLKTEPIRDLLLRYNVGTSYPVIRDEDILNLPIPLLNEKDTADIVKNVITAHKNLAEAKALIDLAKRAVEVFIEKDENAALKVIEAAL